MAFDLGGPGYQSRVLADSPILYLKGQEATGSATSVDSSGNGLDGSWKHGDGTATTAVSVTGPQAGVTAVESQGEPNKTQTKRHIVVPDHSLLRFSGPISWEIITKVVDPSVGNGGGTVAIAQMFDRWDGGGEIAYLNSRWFLRGFANDNAGGVYYDVSRDPHEDFGEWHHIGVSIDPANNLGIVVVDGVEVASLKSGPAGTRSTSTFDVHVGTAIGASGGVPPAHLLTHHFCHVAVYDAYLTAADFLRHITPAQGWAVNSVARGSGGWVIGHSGRS